MSATTEFDVGPLTWVKGEIDLALNRAREHLAQFVQDPSDSSQLHFCLTHLHQVSGAIQMVGLEGVAHFSSELENLVSALEKQEIPAAAETLDLVTQAIAKLSQYLDGLLNGEPYQPLSLFPVYSNLLRARGAERISEADLFFPDLGLRAPKNPEAHPVTEAELPALVKKERAKFQRGLLGWLRQQSSTQDLKMMRKALHSIEQTQPLPANRTFWWSAGAFIESLINQGIEPDFNVKQLCARIDLQMRRLAEGSQKVAERLLRDVLYFVARSAQVSERVREVQQVFELDSYLPPSVGETAKAESSSAQLQPLLRELRELLAPAKDSWLRFTSGNKDSLKPFQEQADKLHSRATALGNQPLERLIGQINAVAKDLPSIAPDKMDAVAMDMATALLLGENALANFEKLTDVFAQQAEVQALRLQASAYGNIDVSRIPNIPLLDEISRKAQEKILLAQVVHEIQTNLRHIEQVLDGFFRDNAKRGELPGLDSYIKQVMGALNILELERAADLLKACQLLIHGFADPERAIEQHELELVADGLSSLGFYIEAIQHGRNDAYNLIEQVLKRCPGFRARAAEAELVVEPEAPAAPASVEAGLDEQKRMTQERLEHWTQQPEDASARQSLREALTALRHDADLVADSALKEQAAAALDLLEQAGDAPSPALTAAIAAIAAPKMQAAPSAEASRLVHATAETVDQELLGIYLEEAEEVLARVSESLQVCREQPHNHDSLTIIRRGFHTLKGSGRMVGLTTLGEVAWNIEQVMNFWLEAERSATPALLELLTMAHESFSRWVAKLKADGAVEVDADALLTLAAKLKGGEPTPPPPTAPRPPEVEEVPQEIEAMVDEPETSAPGAEAVAEMEIMEAPDEVEFAPLAESTPEPEPPAQVEEDAPPALELAAVEALPEETPEAVATEPAAPKPEAVFETIPEFAAIEALEPETEALAEEDVVVGDVSVAPGLFSIFLAEADQHIVTLQGEYGQLQQQPQNAIRHDFMRAAHTLCGIASTTGFSALADLAHALEQWLQEMLEHPVPATDKQLKVTGDTITALEAMVASIRSHKPAKPAKQLMRSLQALLKHARAAREKADAAKAAADADAAAEPDRAESEVQAEAESEPTIHQPAPQRPAEPAAAEPARAATEADRRVIQDDLDEQLLPIFMEEAGELFPQIGSQLRDWRATPESGEISHSLQRSLHTLKGSARMAGAMRLGELTHHMETRVVAATEAGELPPALFDELETEFDRLGDALERLRGGGEAAPEAATPAPVTSDDQPAWTLAARQAPVADAEPAAQKAMLRVRADVVDRLVNEAGEVSIARSRIEGEMLGFKQTLLDLTENVIRLRNQLRETEIQAESQMQSRLSHLHEDGVEFDPLEFDRFSRFQELTRMMAESVNDVSTVQQHLLKNLNETEAALLQQSRMTRDLQQELMRIRMVPLGSLAERLHRIVRQTAKELGKRANLEIRGAHVEIDRSVLEKMTAPFEHLLRNAIAHGLEDRAQRPASKPEFGEIQLEARQQGNEIVLLFSDDGAGINIEAIRAKAIATGMLSATDDVTPAQLMETIFTPGFSTATEVTQVAGRGIGMDVVRSEITGLGGRIEVASELGKGTTFTIYLPLTLAVTQAVLVRGGNHIYALPSAMVEQVQELKPEALAQLYEAGSVDWQGNHYPFSYLPRLLGDQEHTPTPQRYNFVILLRSGAQHAAIHVDELLGNREVVVKNIGPQLARVSGIAGATVLGNGQIVMIINPVQLAHQAIAPHAPLATAALMEPEQQVTAPLIMVVDDSLTVRKITSRLLSREGYQVVTAKDGVDALQQMQTSMPDVMLVDIEMPRMDGFELTKNVRSDQQTADIPIIMITSRTAEKHRNYARELGVNVYLGKPYQEEELLGHIESFLQQKPAGGTTH